MIGSYRERDLPSAQVSNAIRNCGGLFSWRRTAHTEPYCFRGYYGGLEQPANAAANSAVSCLLLSGPARAQSPLLSPLEEIYSLGPR